MQNLDENAQADLQKVHFFMLSFVVVRIVDLLIR
jgi:hypothetical protein